jgi:hypothetical protein
MSRTALRLLREEPDQVLRLQAFRAAHPEVIIGDFGFGVWQARIPEPDGEQIVSRYTLRELLDRLGELTGGTAASRTAANSEGTAASRRRRCSCIEWGCRYLWPGSRRRQ